ncbi:MAG: (4Fe-4S)-binding protein, partial [Acidobacteriota bacterium]|nr:(4Fe-4S)-binding protein [Acidobacteriota bacterium]
MSKVHRYEAKGFVVLYDVERCIHAAECVRGLPLVFDPRRRPWIETHHASTEEVAEVVYRCPTGALRIDPASNIDPEPSPEQNIVEVRSDGPLYLRGQIELAAGAGDEATKETRVALCRCGDSQNKPFCDNSH